MSEFDIKRRMQNPVGTPALSELVRGKKRITILIDDIQRPTPISKIIPCVLEELIKGGSCRAQIVIVMAVAGHRAATPEDFAKKLGADIANGFQTISHDCRRNLLYLGRTTRGTPIYVNRLVAESNLKIGISGIYPNEKAGFGGGSKIIHPGICGFETIQYLHNRMKGVPRGGTIDNEFRADIEEIAEKVGLDFSVNILINQNREVSHLFCGDRMHAYREGVAAARSAYGVRPIMDADVVIANIYPFDTSLHFISKGLWPLNFGKDGRDRVAIASCPEGLGYHALSLQSIPGWAGFFRRMRALSYSDIKYFPCRIRKRETEFLFFSPTVKRNMLKKIYPTAILFNTWAKLIQNLMDKHKKLPVKVAIYSCSPLQIPIV